MCFRNPKNHGHGHDQENLNSWQDRICEVALYLEWLHAVSGNPIRVVFLSLFPECSQSWAGGLGIRAFASNVAMNILCTCSGAHVLAFL